MYSIHTYKNDIIGASLSKPHTSGTALQSVCLFVCLFEGIYRKFEMRPLNISQGLNVLVCLVVKATARVQHQLPEVKTYIICSIVSSLPLKVRSCTNRK